MSKVILEARNIYKKYDSLILNNVSLTLKSKLITAIIGESGSGKSTLMNILGGIDVPDQGELEISGYKNFTPQFRSKNIGFIFQNHYLINDLNVLENVLIAEVNNNKDLAEEALKKVGIFSLKDRFPKFLSGGEQQRVAIARAIVNNPKIILADEPTGNLDPKNAAKILEIFQSFKNDDCCILIITHSKSIYESADIVYELSDGYLKKRKPYDI